jgi:Fe-S oxidoreductase
VQVAAIVISLGSTLAAVVWAAWTIRGMVAVLGTGQPAVDRRDQPARRWAVMLRETFGHTKLIRRPAIGAAHFCVFLGFGFLFFTLLTAYGQVLAGADYALPLIGHWIVYGVAMEVLAWATLAGIVLLVAVRLTHLPSRLGRTSRFFGSTMWQAYFVEAVVGVVAVCILLLRALEYALLDHHPLGHYPLTSWLGGAFDGWSTPALTNAVYLVATVKIAVSMAWLLVLAANATMGVAWHRFAAFPNIWFRRFADGKPALGALPPVYSNGAEVDFTDPGEDDLFGVGKIEDFSWKGLLDFTTCTECGRCQDACPAWVTGKPLSPKLLVLGLRDHAYAKAPALLRGPGEAGSADDAGGEGGTRPGVDTGAAGGTRVAGGEGGLVKTDADGRAVLAVALAEAQRPLVGGADVNGVIDPDVIWSCTNCGACVQECPVDIEHLDHIDNLRRHQVLVEADFPTEFNQLFRGLEGHANPWNAPASGRLDWTRGLGFDVPVVGTGPGQVADLGEVEYLFWVGCAGAFDDRAKKTSQAVAELLHTAGVGFAVLGQAESCSGDPARRAGNEFVYRMLAESNVEVLREAGAHTVIAQCAHCFNTLKNEYAQLGLHLEVLHHTQVLDRLVREGRLTPAPTTNGDGRPITFHDPCFLGRHNQVYAPPRDLLGALPGAEVVEMPRHGDRSFCCGAGGAQMWKEERLGTRVNAERTREALATGAGTIATGCPFCKTMLGDGVNDAGDAAAGVRVVDVAQLLLERVRPAAVDSDPP